MRPFLALYREGFLWLRRDKIFGPILLAGLAVAIFASTASQWSLEDFKKILFDIGIAGFRMTGGLVAIMWGARMVHDAFAERSLDPRLAAPINRSTWYLARYVSLASVLVIMALVFGVWWQLIMYFGGYGWMSLLHRWAFGLLLCEWLILAALSMTLAVFSGFGLSIFVAAALWVAGLVAPLIAASAEGAYVTETQVMMVDWIADVWNFQRFNIVDQLTIAGGPGHIADLGLRLTWAGALLVALLTAGVWRFNERDLG